MYDKKIEIEKIVKDIKEIDDILNAQFFDRSKAEKVIHKHNVTDEVIGTVNSPLNPNVRPFYMLDDTAIKMNLQLIKEYLVVKLAKEQHNG